MNAWTSCEAVARAVAEIADMPREKLVARLTFLAAGMTDAGLREIVVAAMLQPQRRLDRHALGDEQREREAPCGLAAIVGRWPGDETDEEVAAALEEMS